MSSNRLFVCNHRILYCQNPIPLTNSRPRKRQKTIPARLIHDETIPEFEETNSALDEPKRSDAWWVGLTSRRDELGGDKFDNDETICGVDETNSSTRRIGAIHGEMIWEVDETNSAHNSTRHDSKCQFSLGSDFIQLICNISSLDCADSLI